MKNIRHLGIVLLLAVLASCSESETVKKTSNPSDETTQEEQSENDTPKEIEEESTEKETDEAGTTAPSVGLGDMRETFEKENGKAELNYILPSFSNERAFSITIQFEETSDPSRTLDEAMKLVKKHIPSDSQLIREYIDGEDIDLPRKVMEYKSEEIAKVFPDWEPKGVFVVVFNYFEGDENQIIGLTIGLGDTP